MKKKLRKRLTWLVLLVAAAAAVWFFFFRGQAVKFTEETARTVNIETFYTFSSNLEPDGAEVYVATANGSVRQWLVEEGDEVTDSTNVVVYDNGTRVKSPRNGTVSDLYVDAGSQFRAGDALFRVADYAHPKIIIRVDEYDVSAMKKGT